jgi:hypothetical protein
MYVFQAVVALAVVGIGGVAASIAMTVSGKFGM